MKGRSTVCPLGRVAKRAQFCVVPIRSAVRHTHKLDTFEFEAKPGELLLKERRWKSLKLGVMSWESVCRHTLVANRIKNGVHEAVRLLAATDELTFP